MEWGWGLGAPSPPKNSVRKQIDHTVKIDWPHSGTAFRDTWATKYQEWWPDLLTRRAPASVGLYFTSQEGKADISLYLREYTIINTGIPIDPLILYISGDMIHLGTLVSWGLNDLIFLGDPTPHFKKQTCICLCSPILGSLFCYTKVKMGQHTGLQDANESLLLSPFSNIQAGRGRWELESNMLTPTHHRVPECWKQTHECSLPCTKGVGIF